MKRPDRLYKYISLSDSVAFNRLAAILKGSVYFCSPRDFNDPFEVRFALNDHGCSVDEWRTFLENLVGNNRGLLPTDNNGWRQQIEAVKGTLPNLAAELREDIERECSMLCLAERPDVPLMWAHYANSHKGACIEFDAHDDESLFGRAEQVLYRHEFPNINLVKVGKEERARLALLTKAECWAYEREWRVVGANVPAGPQPFEPALVTAVIVGCRISEDAEQKLRELCANRNPPVAVRKACIRAGEYELDIPE